MGKNVNIPLTLLKTLVVLLEYWDVSLFDRAVRDDYWDALWALKIKLLKLDLREAYTMIVKAPNDDARHAARIEYLRIKNQFAAVVDDSCFTSHDSD
jgi:hypothetical protein